MSGLARACDYQASYSSQIAFARLVLQSRGLLPQGSAHARTRRVGKSQLRVTVLGQGGAPIGDLYEKVSDGQALGTDGKPPFLARRDAWCADAEHIGWR